MKYITKTFTYNGKRIYVRGKTEREVNERLIEKKISLEQKKTVVSSNLITDEWFEIYLKTYKNDVSAGTLRDYKSLYRNIIQPFIGHMKINSVQPLTCQNILNSVADKSSSYIKKTVILLRSMFEKALDNELIVKDPTKLLVVPSGTSSERRALTQREREVFLKVSDNGKSNGLFCRIIYYCGLRPSEVARIQGGDYKDGKLYVRGTKTKSAERIVPIPSVLHIPRTKNGTLLFHTSTGNMIDKKRIELYWNAIKKEMRYTIDTQDLTMYCLRHDYCTRLQEAGVPIDVARRLMGHSSIEVTSRIYTHASEEVFNNVSELIDKYNK